MAKTISNLLVGVGFDLDKRSTNKVSSGIDSVKNKALQVTGILAGGFGLKALTSDFAGAKDELGKFAQVFGSTPNDINAFGSAIRLEQGTLQGFLAQLRAIEKFRAGVLVGDIGFQVEAQKAGIDTNTIRDASSTVEAFLSLANQFQRLSPKQRLNAASAIGLDEAAIRLLSKGRKEVEAIVARQKTIRPVTDEQTFLADEFNDSTQDLFSNIGGFADQISVKLLPIIVNVIKGMNDWAEANRNFGESLSGLIDPLIEITEKRGPEAATVLGLGAAGGAGILGGSLLAGGGAALGAGAIAKTGIALGVLSKLLLVAGVVGAGFLAVEQLNDDREGGTKLDLNDIAGDILKVLGIDDGQEKVKQNIQLKQSQIRSQSQRAIQLTNITNIDGREIKKEVKEVLSEEASKAIEDISSSEGG